MNESFQSVSLYIVGDNLSPDAVTSRLIVTPTSVHKKGALKVPGHNNSAVYPTTMWIRSESSENISVSGLLDGILKPLPHGLYVRDIDGVDDAFIDIFVAQRVPMDELSRSIDLGIELHIIKLMSDFGLSIRLSFCNVSNAV